MLNAATDEGKVDALFKLGKFATFVGGGNAAIQTLKQSVQTGEFHPEDIDDNWAEFMSGLIFATKYNRDQMGEGKIVDTALNAITPAMPTVSISNPEKMVRNVPVVGGLFEDHVFGGAERRLERREE